MPDTVFLADRIEVTRPIPAPALRSYYDWSLVNGDIKDRFPIVPDSALPATLGILERTVRQGL